MFTAMALRRLGESAVSQKNVGTAKDLFGEAFDLFTRLGEKGSPLLLGRFGDGGYHRRPQNVLGGNREVRPVDRS